MTFEIDFEILMMEFNSNISLGKSPFAFGLAPFEFKIDDSNCGSEWKIWMRQFELFAKAQNTEDDEKKRDWLLHFAGAKVQEIYFNLPENPDVESKAKGPLASGYIPFQTNVYTDTATTLNNFFEPKRNVSYERHIFRKMSQEPKERIDAFVMRLRIQADRCEFGNQIDQNIKDTQLVVTLKICVVKSWNEVNEI